MAEKKASIVAEKKTSMKKSSLARASLAAAAGEAGALEGDAGSALGLTPEVWFDPNKEEALAAKEALERLEIRALPVRQYLEASVVPLLLHGLQLLAIERIVFFCFLAIDFQALVPICHSEATNFLTRPENPVDFLAKYLIEKNPMNKKDPLKEEKKDGEGAEKKEEKKEEKEEKKE